MYNILTLRREISGFNRFHLVPLTNPVNLHDRTATLTLAAPGILWPDNLP